MTKLKKEDMPQGMGRFAPFERDGSYSLWDIVDTEKVKYVGFIIPYNNLNECEKACNIINVVDYLLKEKNGDVE